MIRGRADRHPSLNRTGSVELKRLFLVEGREGVRRRKRSGTKSLSPWDGFREVRTPTSLGYTG